MWGLGIFIFGNREVAGVNRTGCGLAGFFLFRNAGVPLKSRYASIKKGILGLCKTYDGMQEGTFQPGTVFVSGVCDLALDLKNKLRRSCDHFCPVVV